MAKLVSVPLIQLQLGKTRIRISSKKGYVWCDSSETVVKIRGMKDAELLEDFARHMEFKNVSSGKFEKFRFLSYSHRQNSTDEEMSCDGHYCVQIVRQFIRNETEYSAVEVRRVKCPVWSRCRSCEDNGAQHSGA
jgi:hypothetical protein